MSLNNLDDIKKMLSSFEIKFVVLMVDKDTLFSGDALRDEDCQINEHCVVLLNSFRSKGFDERFVLDSSGLSVEGTVDVVEKDEKFVV